MKRTALAICGLALLAFTLCGCSNSRPFWTAGNSTPNSADIAASSSTVRAGSSVTDRARTKSAERSVDGPMALARLAEHGGSTVEAERLYRSIMEKHPDNVAAPHRLAVLQAQKGHFEEANQLFLRVLELSPDDPAILNDVGYHYYLQNRLDEAEPLFRRALEIRPDHEAATNNLALVLGERGDYRTALKLFRQTGTESEAYSNMGFVYSRKGEIAKAKEAYNRALTLDPQKRTAAEALVQLSRFEKNTETMIAQQSTPEIHAGRAIAAQEATSKIPAKPAASPQTLSSYPVSLQAPSSNRPASLSGICRQAPPRGAETAEFVSPQTPIFQALPVVYPEAIPEPDSSETKRLPLQPDSQSPSVGATIQAIEAGFAKAEAR